MEGGVVWHGLRALVAKRRAWARIVERMGSVSFFKAPEGEAVREVRPLTPEIMDQAFKMALASPCVCHSCNSTVHAGDLQPVGATAAGWILWCSMCRANEQAA
jgi:hypothetical protein